MSAVEHLFEDDEARETMISAGREDARRYSLDNMVENFCNGISLALKSPKKLNKKYGQKPIFCEPMPREGYLLAFYIRSGIICS